MLGDKDQLAAVEAGAVFAELSARPAFTQSGLQRIAEALGIEETRLARSIAGCVARLRRRSLTIFSDAPDDDLFA